MLSIILIAAAAATATMDHGAMSASAGSRPEASAVADIIDTKGNPIGSASFTQGPSGVLMQLVIKPGSGLTPGWHGLHFHDTGKCDGADGFKSAGGHVGMKDAPHGLLTLGKGQRIAGHAGDLPNLGIAADGSGMAEGLAAKLVLAPGKAKLAKGSAALLDADGSALIIHSGTDDHFSQPIGNAGGRAACGVIRGKAS